MSSMDPIPDAAKRKQIEDELRLIAGAEIVLRDEDDRHIRNIVQQSLTNSKERLRRLAYGLPPERKLPEETKS